MLARKVWQGVSDKRRSRTHGVPFTVGFLQRRAGLGEKRAAVAINELRRRKVLVQIGSYRATTHGYRVALYRVAPKRVWRGLQKRALHASSSVRKKPSVKWWEHPLFGNPGGEKPRGVPERTLARWSKRQWYAEEIRS